MRVLSQSQCDGIGGKEKNGRIDSGDNKEFERFRKEINAFVNITNDNNSTKN